MKNYLTKEQVISVLPDRGIIRIFYRPMYRLALTRYDLLKEIERYEIFSLADGFEWRQGYGIRAYIADTIFDSTMFIETDMWKLCGLKKELGYEDEVEEVTNADHLQELTDEEKAHLLTQVFYQAAQQTNAEHYILEWLRKPVGKDEL